MDTENTDRERGEHKDREKGESERLECACLRGGSLCVSCLCLRVCVYACVCMCVRVCVWLCVYVCVVVYVCVCSMLFSLFCFSPLHSYYLLTATDYCTTAKNVQQSSSESSSNLSL